MWVRSLTALSLLASTAGERRAASGHFCKGAANFAPPIARPRPPA